MAVEFVLTVDDDHANAVIAALGPVLDDENRMRVQRFVMQPADDVATCTIEVVGSEGKTVMVVRRERS